MASSRILLIFISLLSFAFHSFGQTVVVISDSPSIVTAAVNPATTTISGGTLIISQDDNQDTTYLTLDANLLGEVADANGNITQIQEALGYGYHNALSKKFITIPVVAVTSIIAYVSVLLADKHLISTNNDIEPIRMSISTSDTNAFVAAGPNAGTLVYSEVGSPGLKTVTIPVGEAAVATGGVDCPEWIGTDTDGCNAQPLNRFCPQGAKYQNCPCKPVYIAAERNIAALASGASLFSAMMNKPTGTSMMNPTGTTLYPSTTTGPLAISTSSVYGCPNPCCYFSTGAGMIAPFLTTTVSGTPTTNCAYTSLPTEDNCPPQPVITTPPTSTSTHCAINTDDAHSTWFSCNIGSSYLVTSPGQIQGDATAPFNCETPAIKGWTTTIALAPGCMCATTLGAISATSIAQLTSGGNVCNPSISSAAPQYSISSLGSGGSKDGLAIPYCVISGVAVPEVTESYGQCYGHATSCNAGFYIAQGGHPSCP